MKRLIIISIILSTCGLLTSCLFQQSDIFDESASDRVESSIQEAKTTLEGASNGWHVRYFPDEDQSYGGYNLFFKFSDGYVTVASEIESDPDYTETSLYSFGQDLGVTLNFDTANSLINYFTAPRNPDGLGSTYKGLGGDYKFQVISVSAEEVVLKGIVSGNDYILTRLDDGVSWADEITAYKAAAADMEFGTYYALVNGVTYNATNPETRRLSITIEDGEYLSAPFIYTKTGISFYKPVTIDGVTAQNFIFKEDYYFEEENGASFNIMTPTPLSSDMELNVSVTNTTYNSVTATVEPTVTDEYYYIGVMSKEDYNTYLSSKQVIKAVLKEINDDIANASEAEEHLEALYSGTASYLFDYPLFNTDYVVYAFGCAISDGLIASTTQLFTTEFNVPSSLLPAETEDNYKRWLGTWQATSTTSRLNSTQITFTFTVKPGEINNTFMITGWGVTMYADKVNIPLYYLSTYEGSTKVTPNVPAASGVMFFKITGDVLENVQINSYGKGTVVTKMYCESSSSPGTYATGSSTSGSTTYLRPAFIYDEDNKGYAVTYNGYYNSNYVVTSFELFGSYGGSSYYLTARSGYTDYDYAVGPYTLVQLTDVDGNVVNTVD